MEELSLHEHLSHTSRYGHFAKSTPYNKNLILSYEKDKMTPYCLTQIYVMLIKGRWYTTNSSLIP